MKVLWVSRVSNLLTSQDMHKNKIEILNDRKLGIDQVIQYIDEYNPGIDIIVIHDDYQNYLYEKSLEQLKRILSLGVSILVFTRDFRVEQYIGSGNLGSGEIKVVVYDQIRLPINLMCNNLEKLAVAKKGERIQEASKIDANELQKKSSFIDRFKFRNKNNEKAESTDKLTKQFESMSRGISRVIAVTGHRGSGLTSTAVNLACEANKRGLSSIILDLDIKYRSTNMYFDKFAQIASKDETINTSLIKTLARPQDYMTTAYNVRENLWLSTLGYNFNDNKLVEHFYTGSKLIGLLSVLRHKFNLIVLDAPMDIFREFSEVLIHIDVFGLCVPNNLYSVISTIQNMNICLDTEKIAFLNAKSKLIVTKYNAQSRYQNDIFTANKVSEALTSGLNEFFTYDVDVAGVVPYGNDFDNQIETDIAVTDTNAVYEESFGKILLRLMEGIQ